MPPLKNLKREQFTSEYIKRGSNATAATLEVYGGSENSAKQRGSQLLSFIDVRERILEKLLTDERTSVKGVKEKLSNLMQAKRPVIVNDVVQMFEDSGIQLETAKTICKLYGVLGVSQEQSSTHYQDNRSINIQVNSADISILSDVVKRLSDIELRQDKVSGLIQVGTESGGGAA